MQSIPDRQRVVERLWEKHRRIRRAYPVALLKFLAIIFTASLVRMTIHYFRYWDAPFLDLLYVLIFNLFIGAVATFLLLEVFWKYYEARLQVLAERGEVLPVQIGRVPFVQSRALSERIARNVYLLFPVIAPVLIWLGVPSRLFHYAFSEQDRLTIDTGQDRWCNWIFDDERIVGDSLDTGYVLVVPDFGTRLTYLYTEPKRSFSSTDQDEEPSKVFRFDQG